MNDDKISPITATLSPTVPPPQSVFITLQQEGKSFMDDDPRPETDNSFDSLNRWMFHDTILYNANTLLNTSFYQLRPYTNFSDAVFPWGVLPIACSKYYKLAVEYILLASKPAGCTGELGFQVKENYRAADTTTVDRTLRNPTLIWDLSQQQTFSFEVEMNSLYPLMPSPAYLPNQTLTGLNPATIDLRHVFDVYSPLNVHVIALSQYLAPSVYPDVCDILIFKKFKVTPYTMTDPRRHRSGDLPWGTWTNG